MTAEPVSQPRWVRWMPPAAVLLFGALYATLSIARYDRLDARSWDLAIFSQAARSYAERGYPLVDVKGPGFNLLGDHFSPVIALFGPLWALSASPVTLLVAQAVLLAVSVAVVLVAGLRHLGPVGGTVTGIAYGLSFGVVEAADFDVHEVAFAAPLLALSGSAYVRRDWRGVCLWAAPLLLVKEDQGLTLVATGAVLVLAGARAWGAGLMLLGAAATAVVLLLVVPALNPAGGYDYWDQLAGRGSDVDQAVLGLAQRVVWPPVKLETLILTFGVTGFMALRSRWALVAVPTLAWRFLSEESNYWGTDWHYSLTLMPIVFLAMIDGVVRAREAGPGWLAGYARHVPGVAVAVAVAVALSAQSPLRDLVRPVTYADPAHEAAAVRVLTRIPADATVATDIGLLAPLVPDHDVYFLGTNIGSSAVVPEWVVIDVRYGWQGDLASWAGEQWPGTAWRDVPLGPGYLVARRVTSP